MASSIANSFHISLKNVIEEPSRMELELDSSSVESEDFSFGQKDIRLDVKLAFARVCNLIDALPDNKESMILLKKIHNEAKSVMRKKRSEAKTNETHLSNITTEIPGEETFLSSQASRRNQQDSFREPLSRSFNGERRSTQLNHSSLLSNGEFESNCLRTIKNGNTCNTGKINLAPISEVEESASFVGDHSSLDSESIQETLGDSETFTLKKWSVKKVDNDLYLTGVKLDRKGNIIERDFVSDKILARPESEVIRTADGDFLLQETLIDPKKIIPEEVRNIFLKEKYFPKNWRKALSLWNEIEKKSQESERAENDKNTSNKGNKKGPPADNKKKTPNQKKTPTEKLNSSGKKTPGGKKVTSDKKTPTGKKTPNDKKNSSIGEPKASKENKKNCLNQSKKSTPVEGQKTENKKVNSVDKNNKDSTDKPQAKKKPRVNKKKEINGKASAPKKRKSVKEKVQKPEEDVEELVPSDGELVFVESDGESMFNLPQTSMTPTGLLASIKKQQIKGRYTPPTAIFDNVYGQSSVSNTPINNTSFANPSNKNNNVVKRLEKAKNTIKTQKKKEAGFKKKIVEDEENDLIGDVLRAAQLKTTTTPTLLKEVFRKQDMSFDESDFDSESTFH